MVRTLSFSLLTLLCAVHANRVDAQQTPTAQQSPQQPPAVRQFQTLEDSWSVALANKDQFALENLLSPTYIDISASAQVTTRNQFIADTLASLPQPLVSIEQKVVNVRVVSDVSVVEGTYKLRLREGGRIRDERGIFTHVWERRRDSWSCISAQRTAVVDQVEGKGKNGDPGSPATAKPSSASEPFHIPLIYKGAPSKPAPQAPATPPQ